METGEVRRRRTGAGWESLTERERAVATLAGEALTNWQIARRLCISPHTVNFHLRQVFRKLGIASRVSLAWYLTGPAELGGTRGVHSGP